MPKRKAAVASTASPKKAKAEDTVTEKPSSGRGRGRPPLSAEEKAKRAANKKPSSGRGRGRPKGSTKASKKSKK